MTMDPTQDPSRQTCNSSTKNDNTPTQMIINIENQHQFNNDNRLMSSYLSGRPELYKKLSILTTEELFEMAKKVVKRIDMVKIINNNKDGRYTISQQRAKFAKIIRFRKSRIEL